MNTAWKPLTYRPGHAATLGRRSLGQAEDLTKWSLREKVLFLGSYGWLAASVANEMPLGAGTYSGVMVQGADLTKDYLSASKPYLSIFSPIVQQMFTTLESETGKLGAATGKSQANVNKYQKLRNDVVEDLVRSGYTVEYERWGDDERFPGEVVKAVVVPEGRPMGSPDFSFIFSPMTMPEFVAAGKKLQDKSEELEQGPDKPFRLDGRAGGPGLGVGPLAIAAVIAAIAFALWAIYAIFSLFFGDPAVHPQKLADLRAAVDKGEITEADSANIIAKETGGGNWFEGLFGDLKLGIGILILVGVAAIGVPALVSAMGWFK